MPDASTILLVDDEDSIQKLLAYPLEREGFRVLHAESGEQGLAFAAREALDCIILDLMLPGMNGYQVCQAIRQRDQHVPIIMLTARGQEAATAERLQAARLVRERAKRP